MIVKQAVMFIQIMFKSVSGTMRVKFLALSSLTYDLYRRNLC